MLELLTDPSAWISFVTLTVLEVILGLDNVIFLAVLVARLPPPRQPAARITGLSFAMLTRVLLLLSITWLTTLTAPLLALGEQQFSGRDLILLAGGVFLLWKSVLEMHATLLGPAAPARGRRPAAQFAPVIAQIGLVDIVFSLDSVFTAIGLAQRVEIMIAAIVIATLAMIGVARSLGAFIERRPTVKVLALAFLLLIGVALIADGWHFHIPRGYLYFAMGFALLVELLNGRTRPASRR